MLKLGQSDIINLMPTYVYKCVACGTKQEIVKTMHNATREEICGCGIVLDRVYTSFQIMGAKVQDAEFNPGLGCVVRNARHRKELADRKGLIEVGNESADTLHRETVVKRAKEREKEWDNL